MVQERRKEMKSGASVTNATLEHAVAELRRIAYDMGPCQVEREIEAVAMQLEAEIVKIEERRGVKRKEREENVSSS